MFDKLTKAFGGSQGLVDIGLKHVGFQQNRRESKRGWNRQLRASNTAYRRAMADMKAAGLNPILAGKFGGASTPQSAIASVDYSGSAQTGMQMAKMDTEIAKLEEEIKNLGVARDLNEEQIKQVAALVRYVGAQTYEATQRGDSINFDNTYKAIISDMYASKEWLAVAKEIGIDAGKLAQIVSTILGAGILGQAAKGANKLFKGK